MKALREITVISCIKVLSELTVISCIKALSKLIVISKYIQTYGRADLY